MRVLSSITNLQRPVMSFMDAHTAADGAAALRSFGGAGGIYSPIPETLSDGTPIPRDTPYYKQYDVVSQYVKEYKERSPEYAEANSALREEVKATGEALQAATSLSEVNKLVGKAALLNTSAVLQLIAQQQAAQDVLIQHASNTEYRNMMRDAEIEAYNAWQEEERKRYVETYQLPTYREVPLVPRQ